MSNTTSHIRTTTGTLRNIPGGWKIEGGELNDRMCSFFVDDSFTDQRVTITYNPAGPGGTFSILQIELYVPEPIPANESPEYVKTHYFTFNEDDNEGEQLTLDTYFYKSSAGEISTLQELTLNSYGNSATFNLSGYFTPENLRKLADELDREAYLA
jgi:hypothetical protein